MYSTTTQVIIFINTVDMRSNKLERVPSVPALPRASVNIDGSSVAEVAFPTAGGRHGVEGPGSEERLAPDDSVASARVPPATDRHPTLAQAYQLH